jgi:hypothetical protein
MSRTAAQRHADMAEIVRFWRSIELFSPQQTPNADPGKRVFDLARGSPAPWEPEHPLNNESLEPGKRWRHTVYCGLFARESAFELVRQQLRPDPESFDDRPAGGDGAVFAFVVSDDGQPVLGSEVLSSCAWAVGRALDPGPHSDGWLQGLQEAELALRDRLEELVDPAHDGHRVSDTGREGPSGNSCALRVDDLIEVTQSVISLLGVERLASSRVRTNSVAVDQSRADRGEEHDFLNSFIASDLQTVADEVADGNLGAALTSYLSFDDELRRGERVDVEKRLDVVYDGVAPRCVPRGRWPAAPDRPLGLSQQLAVSCVMTSLADRSGIFAVNGPPGTGKTTMLREVVADVVVARARQLADLAEPADAFVTTHRWKTGDYTRVVHELKPELTGFEMVVACATNAAAENISTEIPGIDAIDPGQIDKIDYYQQLASRLLNAKRADRGAATEAWAMIAGCLGSMDNRRRFARALWFDARPTRRGPGGSPAGRSPGAAAEGAGEGLRSILKGYEDTPPRTSWQDAVATFLAAVDSEQRVADERARVFDLLTNLDSIERDAELRRRRADAAPAELADARDRLAEQQRVAVSQREVRDTRERELREYRNARPSRLRPLARVMREWRVRNRELTAVLCEADNDAASAEVLARQLELDVVAADRAAREHDAGAAAAARRVVQLRADLAAAAERLGTFLPDERWWEDRGLRERQAPWIDAEWNAARSDLFLASLRLHKAFAMHAAKQVRQSIHGAIDILDGSAPAGVSERAAGAAWRVLFLIVPVLSTSFASFARVFSHLGRESIGWLFIDEAGQCTAQTPAGAIWRSRRVLVVGDPLQLEPVITLPFTAQQAIRREHDVDETWLPSRCSTQTLADRASWLGTVRGSGSDAIWVGAPLNVHRRCDQTIFQIVNEIAYDNKMVNATPCRAELRLPPSKWLDVNATQADGHWIPSEGDKLDTILEHLARHGQDFHEVFVLTPFRQVAEHLAGHRQQYRGITIGTVHTAQGREADIVILILGGNPARPGAKQWAALKPNLLNVAVSRAKRRLYVIGDREAWAAHPYFDILAERLPCG